MCLAIPTLLPHPWPSPTFVTEGCANTAGWVDKFGDGCAAYDSSWCANGVPMKSSVSYTFREIGGVSALDACCTCGGGGLFVSGTAGVFLSTSLCFAGVQTCRVYVPELLHIFFSVPLALPSVCLLRTSWSQASASTTSSSLMPLVTTATTGWDTSATGVASTSNRFQTCTQTAAWPAIYAPRRLLQHQLRHCYH